MRIALIAVVATALLSACGSVEYKDTNAAVDANPQCVSEAGPDELPDPWCKRESSATWTIGGEGEPVDFSGDKDD
ncbi:MAG: hypothetical protein M3Y70_02300 [Pseudomonadota bacterium]|nr:hypothetical protein [Pseudomonadota bacterium]